jgi:hypothetical protein
VSTVRSADADGWWPSSSTGSAALPRSWPSGLRRVRVPAHRPLWTVRRRDVRYPLDDGTRRFGPGCGGYARSAQLVECWGVGSAPAPQHVAGYVDQAPRTTTCGQLCRSSASCADQAPRTTTCGQLCRSRDRRRRVQAGTGRRHWPYQGKAGRTPGAEPADDIGRAMQADRAQRHGRQQ